MSGFGKGIRAVLLGGAAVAAFGQAAVASGAKDVDLDTLAAIEADMRGKLPADYDTELALMLLRGLVVEAIYKDPDAEGIRSAEASEQGAAGGMRISVQAKSDEEGCFRVVSGVLTPASKGKAEVDTRLCAGGDVLTADASKWAEIDSQALKVADANGKMVEADWGMPAVEEPEEPEATEENAPAAPAFNWGGKQESADTKAEELRQDVSFREEPPNPVQFNWGAKDGRKQPDPASAANPGTPSGGSDSEKAAGGDGVAFHWDASPKQEPQKAPEDEGVVATQEAPAEADIAFNWQAGGVTDVDGPRAEERVITDGTGRGWHSGLLAVATSGGVEVARVPVNRTRPTLGLFRHMEEMPRHDAYIPPVWSVSGIVAYNRSEKVELVAYIRNKVKGCALKAEGRGASPTPTDGDLIKLPATAGDEVKFEWSCPAEEHFLANRESLEKLTGDDPELVVEATDGGQRRLPWNEFGDYFVYRADMLPPANPEPYEVPLSEHVSTGFAARWNEVPSEWIAAKWREGDTLSLNNGVGYTWNQAALDGAGNVLHGTRFNVVTFGGSMLNRQAGQSTVAVLAKRQPVSGLAAYDVEAAPCTFAFGVKDALPAVSGEAWAPGYDWWRPAFGTMALPGSSEGQPGIAPVEGRFGCAVGTDSNGGLMGNAIGEAAEAEKGVEFEVWVHTPEIRGMQAVSGGRVLHRKSK